MPGFLRLSLVARALVCAALTGPLVPWAAEAKSAAPGVAVLYDAPWSPGDAPRTGAAEFAVLLRVAQLRQTHPLAGLVCVGNRHGTFQLTTEDTLARVALMGVPVVKLARSEPLAVNPDDIFVEAGTLAPATAERLLADCLSRYGAPPAARNPAQPTQQELVAVRAKVALYQGIFDAVNSGAQVAMR